MKDTGKVGKSQESGLNLRKTSRFTLASSKTMRKMESGQLNLKTGTSMMGSFVMACFMAMGSTAGVMEGSMKDFGTGG